MQGHLNSYAERVERIKRSLRLLYLNNEENNYVLRWADDYADIFHLNGKRHSSTHLIQQRIPAMDNGVIAKKQYTYPHDATDQVILQTEREYHSGIINGSKSP